MAAGIPGGMDTIGALGSLSSGMADFGMGNLNAFFNMLTGQRAAHAKRLTGTRVRAQWDAFMRGDKNYAKVSTQVAPSESIAAVWRDIIPFGFGDLFAQTVSPGTKGEK